jgi:hyperosmotically inducible protein
MTSPSPVKRAWKKISNARANRHFNLKPKNMNIKRTAFFLMVVSASLPLLADPSITEDRQSRDVAQSHDIVRTQSAGMPTKASQIIGREVRDVNNHKIGKVRDLAFDLSNNRIVEVIVATGGFMGIKATDTAVPPGEFFWDADSKKLVCQLDQEQLRAAPAFDVAHWEDSVTSDRVMAIYHRYNIAPYFIDAKVQTTTPNETKGATQLLGVSRTVPLGYIVSANKVIGAPVRNPMDERVGKVDNAIVDLNGGRLMVLIVSTGNYLGMGHEVSAIPPQAFRYDADQKALQLSTTREALRTAPHYKANEWPAIADSQNVAIAYNAYNVPYYQDTMANNSAQNVRDRDGSTVTPMDQGKSAGDRAITARIRREIMSRPGLSTDARNIKIITMDGRVTLRGPVKTPEEESAIIAIAKNAVSVDTQITNQIQTISQPKATPSPVDNNQ